MRQTYKAIILGLLLTGMNFVPLTVLAATSVGKVIVSIGNVVALDVSGKERRLKRRSKIFQGDTIKLADKSRLQARFIDNQLISLKQNTVFRIDEYRFNGKQDGSESAVMSLLKGGMRSVTGAIGKVNKAAYKVKTPIATLGVRGTIWSGQLCQSGSCGSDVADGFYGAVSEGAVVINNEGGEQVFSQDQFFHVPNLTTAPRQIVNPPDIVVENEESSEEEESEAAEETTELVENDTDPLDPPDVPLEPVSPLDPNTPPGPDPIPSPPGDPLVPPTGSPIAGVLAPTGSGLVVAGITKKQDGTIDAGGTTIAQGGGVDSFSIATIDGAAGQFVGLVEVDMGVVSTVIVYDNGVLTEVGGNALGVNWGRWTEGAKLLDDGIEKEILLTGVQFIYSPNLTPASVFPSLTGLGTKTFSFVGGPVLRDETGAALGGSGTITVDFGTTTVSGFSFGASGNNRTYSLSNTNTVNFSNLASGTQIDLTGTCSGDLCGGSTSLIGAAGGQFVGPAAEGIIGYFGASSSAVGGVGITGTGLFKR